MIHNRHKGISIFARILIIFVCVNIVTSGIILVLAFEFHRQSIGKRTKETIAQQLEILRDNFEQEYRLTLKRSLDVLASSSLIDEYLTISEFEKVLLKKKIEQMFVQTLKTDRTYHDIRFVDTDGKLEILVTRKSRNKQAIDLKQLKLKSPDITPPSLVASLKLFETLESIPLLLSGGYMEWFMPPRELQLEGPYVDENGTLSLLAGVSKLDLDIGAFGGVLMIQQQLEPFLEGLRNVEIFNENLIWVFDSQGRILQRPEKEEYRFNPASDMAEVYQRTSKLIDTKKGLVAYQDFSIIPGKSFVRVAISIPAALLLKDISSLVRFFSIVLICSLILVLLVALYVSRYLSRPIIELADAANHLAEGDLTTRVEVETTGEVQTLVNSFNQMAQELQQTILLNVRLDEASKRKEELEQINRKLEGARQELVEREQRYRLLTGNLPGIVYRIDLESTNNLTFFNDMLYPMTGCRDENLKQTKLCALESIIIQEDSEIVIAEVRNAVSKMQPFEIEYRVKHKDGEVRYFLERGRPMKGSSGNPKYIDGVILDITARKQAELEKKKLQVKLVQAQKMESIGTLAGGIAHDFNNILSAIIGFTELALDDVAAGTPQEDNLQEVYTAGKRARDLVKQILAFARQSDEERKPIRVDTIIQEVLKLMRSSIPTTIEIREDIESHSLITGNPSQVHQLFMNLCTNAAQAMEDEGGILEVGLAEVEHSGQSPLPQLKLKFGNYIKVTVSDNGPGISSDIIDSIFEPYFTTKGVGEGTGMGLALVHGIVESYGGKITVESELGKGTVFSIYLPISKVREDHQLYDKEELPFGTERILFVDDELPVAKMSGQVLERLGYQVTIRTSSADALELFRSKPTDFDLVVTDMTMPNLTGDKLAIELMKISPDIPVILCTGYSKQISDDPARAIGIKAFAYKPIVKADLAKTVRKVLDESKS